jgi:NAD(P)H-dependent FMN reductase
MTTESRLNLHVIVASTRPGRSGLSIAQWVHGQAVAHGVFEATLVDLAAVNLPFLDEPNHPRMRQYTKQHTKDWSALVDSADAFVIVTPEYNYSLTAPLKNALDYLFWEWQHKPVGFVSYGGLSGGTRAIQTIKHVVTTLKMVPLVESVAMPFFAQHFSQEGLFEPNESIRGSATTMLDELARMAGALKPLRAQK